MEKTQDVIVMEDYSVAKHTNGDYLNLYLENFAPPFNYNYYHNE